MLALVRRRRGRRSWHCRAITIGVVVAAAVAFVATVAFRVTGIAPDAYDIADRQLTAFISRPDGWQPSSPCWPESWHAVADQGRSGALIGVLVSVTTIPAIGNIGAAAAYRSWHDVGGATLQLAINVTGLVAAGALTLAVQARSTTTPSLRVPHQR